MNYTKLKKIPKFKVVITYVTPDSMFFNIDCLNGKFWITMRLKERISSLILEKTSKLTANSVEKCVAEIEELLAEEIRIGVEENEVIPFHLNSILYPNSMIHWCLITKFNIKFPALSKKFMKGFEDHHIVKSSFDFSKRVNFEVREEAIDSMGIRRRTQSLSATKKRIFKIISKHCRKGTELVNLLEKSTIDYSKFIGLQDES